MMHDKTLFLRKDMRPQLMWRLIVLIPPRKMRLGQQSDYEAVAQIPSLVKIPEIY